MSEQTTTRLTEHARKLKQLSREAASLAAWFDENEQLREQLSQSLFAYLGGGSTLSSGWAHEVLACLRYGGQPNVGHRDEQDLQPTFQALPRSVRARSPKDLVHRYTQVAELALVLWATQRLTELGDLA